MELPGTDRKSNRLRALLRRSESLRVEILKAGDLTLNTASHAAERAGVPVSLTAKEYALLEFLAVRRGKIVTRTELYEHLHDENDTPMSNLVDVHVFNLRKKLGVDFIVTHRGQGYCIGE